MHLVGIGFVIAGCTAYGFAMDLKERLHLREIENFMFAFELLQAEINYGLTPIGEAFTNISTSVLPSVGRVFKDFEKSMDAHKSTDLNALWIDSLEKNKKHLHLRIESQQALEKFGAALGYLDKDMQKKNIEMVLYSLKHIFEKTRADIDKKKNANTTLGFLGGITIVILLF